MELNSLCLSFFLLCIMFCIILPQRGSNRMRGYRRNTGEPVMPRNSAKYTLGLLKTNLFLEYD